MKTLQISQEEYDKLIKVGKLQQIHLYEFTNVLRPRGSMEKESIGQTILERLVGTYEHWTDPKYGDNPDIFTLIRLLRKNLEEEVEAALVEFMDKVRNDIS